MTAPFDPNDTRSFLERARDSDLPPNKWRDAARLTESRDSDARTLAVAAAPMTLAAIVIAALIAGSILLVIYGALRLLQTTTHLTFVPWSWTSTTVTAIAFGSGVVATAVYPSELTPTAPKASLLQLAVHGRTGGAHYPASNVPVLTATPGARWVAAGLIGLSAIVAAVAIHLPTSASGSWWPAAGA